MNRLAFVASLAVSALAASVAAADPPAYVAAAIAAPSRPAADTARDAERKPDAVIAFSGMRPGWKVADFIPGTGYFDRIFDAVVGPTGHVYSFYPTEIANFRKDVALPPDGATPFLGAANDTAIVRSVNAFAAPEPLDLVWLSDNYHDMHDPFFAPADLTQVNKAVFAALKPGGVYLIIDHAAAAGAGFTTTNTLHRIDEKALIAEVEAAGFRLDGESDALRNPADDHSLIIFNPAIRGNTDQFVLRFKKPA